MRPSRPGPRELRIFGIEQISGYSRVSLNKNQFMLYVVMSDFNLSMNVSNRVSNLSRNSFLLSCRISFFAIEKIASRDSEAGSTVLTSPA